MNEGPASSTELRKLIGAAMVTGNECYCEDQLVKELLKVLRDFGWAIVPSKPDTFMMLCMEGFPKPTANMGGFYITAYETIVKIAKLKESD